MTKQKFSIQQEITDQIIAAIEAGCAPWRKPWTGGAGGAGLPQRHNGEPYRGINVLVLWSIAASKGYTSARWMTFKQAKDLGGAVRKGEKSSQVVYYTTTEIEDNANEGETKVIPFAKSYRVFNADQIDGLPEEFYTKPNPARDLGTERDPELDAFFAATGADIRHSNQPRAFYNIGGDFIHMPEANTFHDTNGYYATLAHELTHWTGADKRLDRFKRHSDRKAYAFEELVAEIGNCLICATLGMTPDFDQSGAYIEGWMKAMKEDNRAIFRAASEAQKALDFVQGLTEASQKVAAE
jgi:antirestriction protein ArdC